MMESLTNEIYEEGLKVINEVRPGVCLNLRPLRIIRRKCQLI